MNQERYDGYRKELEKEAQSIITGVKEFYFSERHSLLACILFIANEASNESDFTALFRDCFVNKLCKKELPISLVRSLMRSLEVDNEFRHYRDEGVVGQDNP